MLVRRIATTAALALLPLAPAGLAHAATPSSASGNHVTHIRTSEPLDTVQPALAANGCRRNGADDWVVTTIDADVSGPAATAAVKADPPAHWKATLVYERGSNVRARVPLSGYSAGDTKVSFDMPCEAFTALERAGFGAGISTARLRLSGVTATFGGHRYSFGSSPTIRQRVRQMYRAVARTWHRSGSRVTVTGAAQKWVRHGKRYQWRNTRAGVPVLIDTSCRTKTHVRRTGPRGRFVFRTTRARFHDGVGHAEPMVETEIKNTRTRSGEVDGWWWRPGKHRFDETAYGLYCAGD